MSVGEALGITLAQTPLMVADDRHELNMIFNFDAVRVNRDGKQWKSWTLPQLKAIYSEHAKVLGPHDWDTVFLSNHDNPRIVSGFGDDSAEFRAPSAKLLETMLLTLRGTVVELVDGLEGIVGHRPGRCRACHRGAQRIQGRRSDPPHHQRGGLPRQPPTYEPRQRPHPHAVGRLTKWRLHDSGQGLARGQSEFKKINAAQKQPILIPSATTPAG